MTYASDLFVSEDTVFVEIGETPGLLDQERGETERIRLIMGQLRVHVIVNLKKESVKMTNLSACRRRNIHSTRKTKSVSDELGLKFHVLTAFSRVAGLPKRKSPAALKKGRAASASFLNSSDL